MSRILRLMALCCAALCSQMTFAQPRVIGIDELFRLAEEQSMSIRSFESGAAAAAEGVRAARAERLPDVGVTVSASFLGDGRLWDRSFGEGMKVDIPHFGNNFALEAQQVVYAGGAVRSGIRMAELEQRDAETSLERNRQDICFLLLGHYLNLYKADNRIRVLRENLALTEQVLETMRARREQGTVLQNDITRYELRREQLRLELQRHDTEPPSGYGAAPAGGYGDTSRHGASADGHRYSEPERLAGCRAREQPRPAQCADGHRYE